MTVEEYAAKLPDWQQAAVKELIECVHHAVPHADLAIKWSQPVFSSNGPFCFIKPAKAHLSVGFWWGAKIKDPDGLLQGSGDKMRHMKFAEGDTIDCASLASIVVESERLNHELGNPTTTRT